MVGERNIGRGAVGLMGLVLLAAFVGALSRAGVGALVVSSLNHRKLA